MRDNDLVWINVDRLMKSIHSLLINLRISI